MAKAKKRAKDPKDLKSSKGMRKRYSPAPKLGKKKAAPPEAASYQHPTADSPLRPDVGTQAQFRKKKPPVTYRYDSSLSPALDWDGQNPAREQGEAHLATVEEQLAQTHSTLAKLQKGLKESDKATAEQLKSAAENLAAASEANRKLKAMSKPFLNWAGKAERLSFDVPTLPLFVHERLSTRAIIDTLTGHKKDQQMALFADPQRSITDQVLKAYEHRDKWVNRMILGDSLVVMNSLLHYEGLGGQVQMIYMDPPYGVKFGSNFQPFVRKREVHHSDDEDMTREPEMVKAYRDTWELGLHSYLTYLRDRLTLARELLAQTGSLFVQISEENLHHVRELMDEIFGASNHCATVSFRSSISQTSRVLPEVTNFVVWYSRDHERVKYRQLYLDKDPGTEGASTYTSVELPDGKRRRMTDEELAGTESLPDGSRVYSTTAVTQRGQLRQTTPEGLKRLIDANRIVEVNTEMRYVRYLNDFPVVELKNLWNDTITGSFTDPKLYIVQTNTKVVQRCVLMVTDPGDLVLDPTCGSGTTAYVAEQWGRRWITADVSRVPLALARQRLLTATFPWYELKDESRGPAGGFLYKRKQDSKGAEVGGIVPHITLKSIATNEPSNEEVLVDRPEEAHRVIRVTGPFSVEASIPTPVDWEGDGVEDSGVIDGHGSFVDRMLEVLRKSPVLRLGGNKAVTLRNVRPPAKTLSLSAEALVEGHAPGSSLTPAEAVQISKEQSGKALPFTGRPVAFVFGPESGAVSEKLVYEAAREAHAKSYTHLYVIGFAIQPNARKLVEDCDQAVGIAATYVQATPDLLMGDLLKNMRSSQIFSVCGLPEIKVSKVKGQGTAERGQEKYQVELVGVDVFDPITMENDSRGGNDVPAWFLDIDYNGLCFHVCQAFFPRTAAWDNLKRALRATHEETVWDHLAGSVSAPFEPGEHKQVAVKVIDDRGNELLVVKGL